MAASFRINGVSSAVDADLPVTTNSGIQDLMHKIWVLEQKKQLLMNAKQSDKKTLDSIAARAAELETEGGQEANAELSKLKRVVERLKKSKSEKTNKIAVIEKEMNLLLDRLSEFVFVEDDVKSKIDEKDDDIRSLKRIIDEFQSVVAKNRTETKRLKKEKDELEIEKNDLEALLKKSERRVKEMEEKIDGLHKELEAYISKYKYSSIGEDG